MKRQTSTKSVACPHTTPVDACGEVSQILRITGTLLITSTSRRVTLGPLDALRLLPSSLSRSSECRACSLPKHRCCCSRQNPALAFLHLSALSLLLVEFSPSRVVDLIRFACFSTSLSMYSFVRLWAASAFAVPFPSSSILFPHSSVCLMRLSPEQRHASGTSLVEIFVTYNLFGTRLYSSVSNYPL